MQEKHILDVQDLTVTFQTNRQSYHVVDGISFQVNHGEILGIVGESGCGKSITSLSIMGLIKPPGKVTRGRILFKGQDLLSLDKKAMRRIRGNQIAMIFQEPMTSLNPVLTIGNQIGETLKIHTQLGKKEIQERVVQLLKMVGIPRAEQIVDEYPHQLSGGMRQRVMIAMAMACDPDLLIADEPTTALDVTIQAQILELMKELQQTRQLSMILITHDLGVVSEMCDRVMVMYAGRIVETAPVRDILERPQHPYTQALLNALPKKGQKQRRLFHIPGQVPHPAEWGSGCRFADRCPSAMDKCLSAVPPLIAHNPHHQSACWLYEKGGEKLGGNDERCEHSG